jgi:hypothetical protein
VTDLVQDLSKLRGFGVYLTKRLVAIHVVVELECFVVGDLSLQCLAKAAVP